MATLIDRSALHWSLLYCPSLSQNASKLQWCVSTKWTPLPHFSLEVCLSFNAESKRRFQVGWVGFHVRTVLRGRKSNLVLWVFRFIYAFMGSLLPNFTHWTFRWLDLSCDVWISNLLTEHYSMDGTIILLLVCDLASTRGRGWSCKWLHKTLISFCDEQHAWSKFMKCHPAGRHRVGALLPTHISCIKNAVRLSCLCY